MRTENVTLLKKIENNGTTNGCQVLKSGGTHLWGPVRIEGVSHILSNNSERLIASGENWKCERWQGLILTRKSIFKSELS